MWIAADQPGDLGTVCLLQSSDLGATVFIVHVSGY
jgi:hypothetical protein